MATVKPLSSARSIKKRTKKFARFISDQFKRVGPSWRRSRGIDNPMRRRFKGSRKIPKIGYRTATSTRHVTPSGFVKFAVRSPKELEMLLMHNRKYVAEIASSVSAKKRRSIVARAAQLNIRVANAAAKVRTQESE
eukprot:comp21196_c1_seq1/m.45096 comp21196_c1_seq1/g.45096  ORF comp21196_c1_seq1/g.45096 comp21196_c1_seq1/m.45096 type:complete len:136 (-) comp21196_c1_seq1:21-428(-)